VTGRAIFSASITRSLLCCTSVQLFFMIQGGRYRNWVFTLNNPAYALTPELDLVGSACTFLVWQLECGLEGTEHYQGYLELDRPCSLLQVLQMGDHMFLGAHFEVIYFAPKSFFCARVRTRCTTTVAVSCLSSCCASEVHAV